MAAVQFTRCDGCGKTVEDRYLARGWIHLSHGSISPVDVSRSVERKEGDRGDAVTDYLHSVQDFCSIGCLEDALDAKARRRSDDGS
jgi:hypothetical protein